MTKKEFKVGDRVAVVDSKYSGIVTAFDDIGCHVRYEDGEELYLLKDLLHHSDLPPYDRRTSFLTELQSLLRKYDATIDIAADYGYSVGLSLSLNGEEVIHDREVTELHADNIMDFDKE